MTANEGDLRSRRRKATARDIHLATLRLAVEHGFDHVTVDMISAAAGVSRRTFFNYFPTKEAAVIAGPRTVPDDALAQFLASPQKDPPQVLRDLTRLLLRELELNQPDRDELRQVMALAAAYPSVLATLLASFDTFEQFVATTVAQRLGAEPGDETATLIAAVGLAAMRTGLQRWAHGPASESSPQVSPLIQVEHTLTLLHGFLIP
ncbi:TetR family transcriptional regulator [Kineosporia sp. NBRC 101731]|uniref:TetR family transcriptional regulator n=1 Tax=Kineosporia sp. NBRC 101731 TaxID=3032199 RepID=UPI0025537653|nr:TetR family transcriptional regulator [Kineosporia sp. NBRC 101731]